jgi:hypothetical protein
MASLRTGHRIAREVFKIPSAPQLGQLGPRKFATTTTTRSATHAAIAEIEEPIRVAELDPSVVESFKTENRLKRRDGQLPGAR